MYKNYNEYGDFAMEDIKDEDDVGCVSGKKQVGQHDDDDGDDDDDDNDGDDDDDDDDDDEDIP